MTGEEIQVLRVEEKRKLSSCEGKKVVEIEFWHDNPDLKMTLPATVVSVTARTREGKTYPDAVTPGLIDAEERIFSLRPFGNWNLFGDRDGSLATLNVVKAIKFTDGTVVRLERIPTTCHRCSCLLPETRKWPQAHSCWQAGLTGVQLMGAVYRHVDESLPESERWMTYVPFWRNRGKEVQSLKLMPLSEEPWRPYIQFGELSPRLPHRDDDWQMMPCVDLPTDIAQRIREMERAKRIEEDGVSSQSQTENRDVDL